jgi:hypothetical protein
VLADRRPDERGDKGTEISREVEPELLGALVVLDGGWQARTEAFEKGATTPLAGALGHLAVVEVRLSKYPDYHLEIAPQDVGLGHQRRAFIVGRDIEQSVPEDPYPMAVDEQAVLCLRVARRAGADALVELGQHVLVGRHAPGHPSQQQLDVPPDVRATTLGVIFVPDEARPGGKFSEPELHPTANRAGVESVEYGPEGTARSREVGHPTIVGQRCLCRCTSAEGQCWAP